MAVHKVIRSNPQAQLQPQRRRPNPHAKAEIFDTLRQLNRGYGSALAALHRLQYRNQNPGIFPAACLRDYSNRTETLRALANHDLLQLLAEHEERDAARFGRSAKTAKHHS